MDNWLVAVVAGAFLLGLIIGIARGAIKNHSITSGNNRDICASLLFDTVCE